MDVVTAVGEWKGWIDRLLVDGGMADGGCRPVTAGFERDHSAGIRGRRRTRGAVLRARQLVSRWCGADALHRMAERRAEPGAADVPARHVAGRPDTRVEVLRSRAAGAAGRLVAGFTPPAGDGHSESRRCPEGHFRRHHAWHRDRWRDDRTDA